MCVCVYTHPRTHTHTTHTRAPTHTTTHTHTHRYNCIVQARTKCEIVKSEGSELSAEEMKAQCAAALAVEAAQRGLQVVRDALNDVVDATKAADAAAQGLIRRCESENRRAR